MSQIDEFEAHVDLLSEVIGQAHRLFDRFKIAPNTTNKKLFALKSGVRETDTRSQSGHSVIPV